MQILKRVGSTIQTALHLSHSKADNIYRINNVANGEWDTERQIITNREMQVNLNLPEQVDMNNFNGFGFFSGINLKNSPTTGWFQFMVFPLNNNLKYAVQIGFFPVSGSYRFFIRSKYNESWAGVSWKEFNVSFK